MTHLLSVWLVQSIWLKFNYQRVDNFDCYVRGNRINKKRESKTLYCFCTNGKLRIFCLFNFRNPDWLIKPKPKPNINSSIEVVYIWTIAGSLSDTLSGGFRWLSLVIAGYPWLPHDYFIWPWLQKISANDGKDNWKCANNFTYIGIVYITRDNQG